MNMDLSEHFAKQLERDVCLGRVCIRLSEEAYEDAKAIGEARAESYQNGETKNTNFSAQKDADIHVQGATAEFALSVLYPEANVDRTISAWGDGGVDCRLALEGRLVDVDVKSSRWEDAWLQLPAYLAYKGVAEAYVIAYVVGAAVQFRGWMWAEDVFDERFLETDDSGRQTYTVRETEDLNRLPEPPNDVDCVAYETENVEKTYWLF